MKDLPLDLANINSANQIVISGQATAIPDAEKILSEALAGEKPFRYVKLNVSAPFHSRFMKPIAEPFLQTLKDVGHGIDSGECSQSGLQILPVDSIRIRPTKIISNLVNQLSNAVRWRDNMQALASRATDVYEIGPGRPLREFFKTIDVACQSITGLASGGKSFWRCQIILSNNDLASE